MRMGLDGYTTTIANLARTSGSKDILVNDSNGDVQAMRPTKLPGRFARFVAAFAGKAFTQSISEQRSAHFKQMTKGAGFLHDLRKAAEASGDVDLAATVQTHLNKNVRLSVTSANDMLQKAVVVRSAKAGNETKINRFLEGAPGQATFDQVHGKPLASLSKPASNFFSLYIGMRCREDEHYRNGEVLDDAVISKYAQDASKLYHQMESTASSDTKRSTDDMDRFLASACKDVSTIAELDTHLLDRGLIRKPITA